jgi:predicted ATPase/class 3 adenylate cyclase
MLAFLFTDIENSTQWWHRFPDDMGVVLARHDALLAETIQRFGGKIVKNTGDGVFAVFEDGQPLACSLAIQHSVTAQDWGKAEGLRVRVALNAGEAEQRGADYFGPAVNRAARLLNVGWGGQILLTRQTAEMLVNQDGLPTGASLNDFGLHVLKGLDEPLHILGLVHSDLPIREFPALRSLTGHLNTLPAQPTPFVGRDTELADIDGMFNDPNCRLLTITGPGGIGKTRLAIQYAALQMENFPHGVYLVSLAPVDSPDLIPQAIGEALKVTFYSHLDIRSQIQDYLREKSLLLVLDNFEHLLPGSVLLTTLLFGAHHLKILTTSRERLNLQGEWIYELHGMPYPHEDESIPFDQYEAIKLFHKSAARVRPAFKLNSEDKVHVRRICQLVDGNPLGIELAASWVRSLSCREIADEIEHNLDFLESPWRDIPERHQSLRAVFEYSWDLLSEEDRRSLRKLSVFHGGFDRQAARYVAAVSLTNLMAFVDKSLLQQSSTGRYNMLETMRQYAENKHSENPDEWLRTNNLHSEYYAGLLHRKQVELKGFHQQGALEEIRNDIENVRVAWEWAVAHRNRLVMEKSLNALFSFYDGRGRIQEGKEVFSRAVQAFQDNTRPEEELLLCKLAARLGWFWFLTGNYRPGGQYLEGALQTARQLEASREIAFALLRLGEMNHQLGNLDIAKRQFVESISLYQALEDDREAASAGHLLGVVLFEEGDSAQARHLLQDSLDVFTYLGDLRGRSQVLNSLSKLVISMQDFEEAQRLREQSLELARQLGDRRGMAVALISLSDIAWHAGDVEKCHRLTMEALEISRKIGDRRMTAIYLNNLALVFTLKSDGQAESRNHYQESLQLFRELGDQRGIMFTSFDLGCALLGWGDYNEACRYFYEALEIAVRLEISRNELYVLIGYTRLFFLTGLYERSLRLATLLWAHSQSDSTTQERALLVLEELKKHLPEETIARSQATVSEIDLAVIVQEVLREEPKLTDNTLPA